MSRKHITAILAMFFLILNPMASFSQSKKKQINNFKIEIDSLTTLLETERYQHDLKENQLKTQIAEQAEKTRKTASNLKSARDSINTLLNKMRTLNQEGIRKTNLLDSLNLVLNNIMEELNSKAPLQILSKPEVEISDPELMALLGVKLEEAPESLTDGKEEVYYTEKLAYKVAGRNYLVIVLGIGFDGSHGASGSTHFGLLKYTDKYSLVCHAEGSVGDSWGGAADLERIIQNGKNSLAILIEGGMSNQGTAYSDREIVMIKDEKIETVYAASSYEFDGQKETTITINFKDNGKDVFDLIEIKKVNDREVARRTLRYSSLEHKYK
jgi:hypothetical protein